MRLGETPVPIPNTTVKTQAADGTALETVWESRRAPDQKGDVAQLGEHLPCKQGVESSNLFISIARALNEHKPEAQGEFSARHVTTLNEKERSEFEFSDGTRREWQRWAYSSAG